jgi:anti-sigma regulatory factor (Ser/Thr protein kinase)
MILEPLTIVANKENLSQLMDYVAWSAAAIDLDEAAIYGLSLAVDEIATNTVLYGYAEEAPGNITIWGEADENRLVIYLEDSGRAFDPREAPPPEGLDRPLEEREDGGLGIFLALWGVDDFVYERVGGKNRSIFVIYRPDRKNARTLGSRTE